jgi:hypothetical protein
MNKLAKSILSAFGFIFVVAIAASWTAPHVIAQIKAALVQDIDNPARHVWTFANSNNSTYTVPAGQTLVIEEIGGLTGNPSSRLPSTNRMLQIVEASGSAPLTLWVLLPVHSRRVPEFMCGAARLS